MHAEPLSADSVALVQGASRGIGLAFVRHLADSGRYRCLVACCRDPMSATELGDLAGSSSTEILIETLDVSRADSIAEAAERIAARRLRLDLLLNVAGLLHQGVSLQPEKRLEDLDFDALARVFAVNALGPALMMRHFLPLMCADRRSVFAVLSARVGSIGDNRLGGWYGYRASKAALNQFLRTAAVEARRRFPETILVALHPGTTDTALSAPFQARVAADKLFSPALAVERMLAVIEGLEASDSGGFLAWDGQTIPW